MVQNHHQVHNGEVKTGFNALSTGRRLIRVLLVRIKKFIGYPREFKSETEIIKNRSTSEWIVGEDRQGD